MGFFKSLFGGSKSVEDRAVEYNEKMTKAAFKGDFQKLEKLEEEMNKWYEGLSEEDKKKADEAKIKSMENEMDKMIDKLK